MKEPLKPNSLAKSRAFCFSSVLTLFILAYEWLYLYLGFLGVSIIELDLRDVLEPWLFLILGWLILIYYGETIPNGKSPFLNWILFVFFDDFVSPLIGLLICLAEAWGLFSWELMFFYESCLVSWIWFFKNCRFWDWENFTEEKLEQLVSLWWDSIRGRAWRGVPSLFILSFTSLTNVWV